MKNAKSTSSIIASSFSKGNLLIMDIKTPEQRSWNMSRIHSQDTKPEMVVRSSLHKHGFRFHLHVKNLPGHPDIVLPKYRTVIEVRGCFWHRHPGCKIATMPTSNIAFWKTKFEQNVARDKKNADAIRMLGWKLIVVWECQIKNPLFLERLPARIKASSVKTLRFVPLPKKKSSIQRMIPVQSKIASFTGIRSFSNDGNTVK